MSWTRDRLKTNGRIAFKKNYWSCVAVAVIMGIITWLFYHGCHALLKSNAISTILAIMIAAIVYAVTLLLFKGLSEEEILRFPKGALLVRIAKKLHLLR